MFYIFAKKEIMSFRIDKIKMLDKQGCEVELNFATNSNLNLIIGLNGSGKSYLLDLIYSSFLLRDSGSINLDMVNNGVEIYFSRDEHKLVINSDTWDRDDGYLTIICDNIQYYYGEQHKEYRDGEIVNCENEEFAYIDDLNKYLPSNILVFNNSKDENAWSRNNNSNIILFNAELVSISLLSLFYASTLGSNDIVNDYIQSIIHDESLSLKEIFIDIQVDPSLSNKWFESEFKIKEWNNVKGFYKQSLTDYFSLHKDLNRSIKDFFWFHYQNVFRDRFSWTVSENVISSLSDGLKNYALLLCMAIVADENSIILLDEPDASIDYTKKMKLINILKKCPGQIFLTSHNPVLVSNVDPNAIIMLDGGHLSKNVNVARALSEYGDYNMLDALGIQGMPYLVVVEGPSDDKIIRKAIDFLDYTQSFNDVFFLSAGGSGNTEHFYNNTLTRFPKNNIKKVLFIFDRDKAGYSGGDVIERLKKSYKKDPSQFNNDNITPDMLDYYLYTEQGKNDNYYKYKPHNPNKTKDAYLYFFYLENYIKEENYFYEGRNVVIVDKMTGKQLKFNELMMFCPSESESKRWKKSNNNSWWSKVLHWFQFRVSNKDIISSIEYGDNKGNITYQELDNIVKHIKDDVLNGNHEDIGYFENFKYLLDDILRKLGIIQE